MKILSLLLLALVLSGCAQETESGDDSSLLDMYDSDGVEDSDESEGEVEEEPYSEGPSEIPDDLVLPE